VQDPEHLVEQGIEALMVGERPRARELLQAALKQDPRNEQGWLALSFAVDKPEHALECVKRVLTLNPQHERAHERLADLQGLATTSAAPQAQPPAQAPAPRTPAVPAQWATESDALQAKSECFFFEPDAARFVRGEMKTLPIDGCMLLVLIPIERLIDSRVEQNRSAVPS
jgi:tetratricopeptide (TPR) repeat protein